MKHCDCRKIAIIEEAAEGIKESKQTTDFLQLILHWKNVLEKSIEDTEKNMSAVAIIGNNLVLEIESLKKDVNEHIDRLEIAVKDELTTRKEERVTKLTDRGTKVSSLKSIVDNWHNIYRTCIHDGSEIHCLIEINKMILMKEKMASEIHTATSHIDEKSFRFERNQIVKYLQENVRSLGFINIVNTKPSTGLRLEPLCDSFSESFVHMPETSNFRKGTINKLFTLYIGDNDNNEVRGLFTEEFIFISSYKTDKLLKFDLNGKFLCDRKFKARSWCVTEFRGDELALIFGSSKEIHFLNVYTLVIERKINLAVSVNLLRYISENDQFVATCSMGRSIFWLNAISGEKIKEETASKNQQVHYICAYGSNGYVFTSGWNDNISLLVNNRIKYTYNNKDISRSRGVDIDFHGNLYLCCPNSVHQISPLGELIRKIPCEDIGTSNPCAIRFKQNSNLFLLTSFDSGKVVVAEIC
ncbi:uncharacterized protein LOC134718238 [Mytilus trossulus]|uniref:uncharacterized protein LOC134718238 n=1 Tax=Mytilus trossulus TaxID=6551 RepID=UPI003005EAB5